MATRSSGESVDVSGIVVWSSSDVSLATVDGGTIETIGIGTVEIRVTDPASGLSGRGALEIGPAVVSAVSLTPSSPRWALGTTGHLAATAILTDRTTEDVTGEVAWTTSDPDLAGVSMGLVVPVGVGVVTITGSLRGADPVSVAVEITDAVLTDLEIVSSEGGVLPAGTICKLRAIATFSDSTTQNVTGDVDWDSSAPGVASLAGSTAEEATLSANGLGESVISVVNASPEIVGQATFTVTSAGLVSIETSPVSAVLPLGSTVNLIATGIYSDATTVDMTQQLQWSSSDTTTAAVSNLPGAQGHVVGVRSGDALISATDASSGNFGTTIVTVVPAVLHSISVDPPGSSLAIGTALGLTATGIFSDGSTFDLTDSVTWTSSDGAVASVSNADGTEGLTTAAGMGVTLISAIDPALRIEGTTSLTVTPAALTAVAVTPSAPSLAAGTTVPFMATGTYSDGSVQDLTDSVTWQSSSLAVVTISNALGTKGQAAALAPGLATITCTDPETLLSDTASLAVVPAALDSISLSPAIQVLAQGSSSASVATGIFTDGSSQDISALVTWSSGDTAVASVSNAPGSQGSITAVAAGSTAITATDPASAVSGFASITVNPATLVSVAIASTPSSIPLGTTVAFVATGTFSDGSTQDVTAALTWSSSDLAVATISNAQGASGVATSVSVGVTSITALHPESGLSGTGQLTVYPARLESLSASAEDLVIAAGTIQPSIAVGIYTDGSTLDLSSAVTWSSSDTAVATVSNAPGTKGLLTSLGTGSITIRAVEPVTLIEGSYSISVTSATLASIGLNPALFSIAVGTDQSLSATGTYTDGSTQDLTGAVTWTVLNGTLAAVSSAVGSEGRVTALRPGATSVTATGPGGILTGTAALTVTPATLDAIQVTPATPSVPLGSSQAFVATGVYSDGSTQDVTAAVTWTSTDDGVATISNALGTRGIATSVSLGLAAITALHPASGLRSTAQLTVNPATLVSLSASAADLAIAAGTVQASSAVGIYSDGSTQDLSAGVTWSSSDAAVATVSNVPGSAGLVTSVGVGSSTIRAVDPATLIEGSYSISVTSATLASISVVPALLSIAVGTDQALSATGTYTDGSTQDLTDGVTWISANGAVAAISNAAGSEGRVTGLAPGATTVTATGPGGILSATAALTVTPATLSAIQVTPAAQSIPLGNSQAFVATGVYSDGSIQDVTAAVTWSSTDAGVAIISNAAGAAGVATSVGTGVTTIRAFDPDSSIDGATTLTVSAATLVSIAVTPGSPTVLTSFSQQFTATGTYSDGTSADLTDSVTWTSSDSLKASISNSSGSEGLATGLLPGVALITALSASTGVSGSATLTVF